MIKLVDSLFVFGNGLGRALDNDFFDLKRALEQTWDKIGLLTEAQKGLIFSCLPAGVIEKKMWHPRMKMTWTFFKKY